MTHGLFLWRAGCGESRTSGSEGGPGRRASGNVRTAPRTRPYWATSALDKVRRAIWNQTRRSGQKAEATELKGSRWVLLRNAQDLTANETAKLALVAKLNAPLYRAYLLKEQLRMVFHVGYEEAIDSLSAGSNGRGGAASVRSWHWPGPSRTIAPTSRPRCCTASITDAWSRSIPRSG